MHREQRTMSPLFRDRANGKLGSLPGLYSVILLVQALGSRLMRTAPVLPEVDARREQSQ